MTLAELEARIEHGLDTFVDVGLALLEIRDRRLYRESHATFEDYCRERWAFTRRRANQLIGAAGVIGVLGTTVPNEAQAREFSPLREDPEAMRATWADVTASPEPVTARRIRAAVRRVAGANPEPTPDPVAPAQQTEEPTETDDVAEFLVGVVDEPVYEPEPDAEPAVPHAATPERQNGRSHGSEPRQWAIPEGYAPETWRSVREMVAEAITALVSLADDPGPFVYAMHVTSEDRAALAEPLDIALAWLRSVQTVWGAG